MQHVDVAIKEDDSVEKLLSKTAKSLQRKYAKHRQVNEALLKPKTTKQKILSICADIACVILVLFASIVCFSGLNSRIQKVCPTFAGYSNLKVQTGSMVASGFNVGDSLIVKTVNTRTLHENDKIAFYVYADDYKAFDVNTCVRINNDTIAQTSYTTSVGSLFGIQTTKIATAAKSGAKLVFHHIRAIYEDASGTRWFKTYGSSNSVDDLWFISEDMVVGVYVDSPVATFFSKLISATNSRYGFLILLVPVLLLAFIIVIESLKNVQLARLELDCVEEKRKITDPICVRNNVGFNMDSSTKYKILAQASSPEQVNEYIGLLWRGNSAPLNIKKYYARKNILLSYNRKMLELNRQCEKMFKNGEKPNKVAKFYRQTKEQLQTDLASKNKELIEIANS